MIKIVKEDYEKLQKLHIKASKKKFSFKKPDPEKIKKREEDLELIKKHIAEIEELDKRRHQRDTKKKSRKHENDEEYGMQGSLAEKLMLATQLPDDPTKSNLPTIDISQQMLQLERLNKTLDEKLDIFGEKLDKLKEAAQDIGGELDRQNIMLENLEDKVEKEMQRLDALNKRVENALDAVGGSCKLICIVAIIIVIVGMVGIAAVFIINYFPAAS